MNEMEARVALDAVRQSRARLGREADWPASHHIWFATVLSGFVAVHAVPMPYRLAGIVLLLAAVFAMLREQRRRGLFVNGYRAGRTAWVIYPLVAFCIAAIVTGAVLQTRFGMMWGPLWMAIPVWVAAYAGSRAWTRLYLRDLEDAA